VFGVFSKNPVWGEKRYQKPEDGGGFCEEKLAMIGVQGRRQVSLFSLRGGWEEKWKPTQKEPRKKIFSKAQIFFLGGFKPGKNPLPPKGRLKNWNP